MNIRTIRDNLRRTITSKEMLLDTYKIVDPGSSGAKGALIQFLEININELKNILADVEKCCGKESNDSWSTNPDRSGGQFTQEEIDNSGKW